MCNANIDLCVFPVNSHFEGAVPFWGVIYTSKKGMGLSTFDLSVNCMLPVWSMLLRWAVNGSLWSFLTISNVWLVST